MVLRQNWFREFCTLFSLGLVLVSRFRQKCLPLKEMLFELGWVFVRTQEIITRARLESPLVASE